jgi:hypothetical protein
MTSQNFSELYNQFDCNSGSLRVELDANGTGAHRYCAAWRRLVHTLCGAVPVRVRVEQPVRAHGG